MSNPSDSLSRIHLGYGNMPVMDEGQFLRWQNLLEERTGMCLAPQRKSFLQTSLGIRMREIGVASYEDYYQRVVSGPGGAIEWSTLVDRLTVQETRFFRDQDAMNFVRNHLTTLSAQHASALSMDIWSMGCSSGEEAYSLAMLADEVLSPRGFKYSVTGTDISTVVLRKARQGQYIQRKLQSLPDAYQTKYFTAAADGQCQVDSLLRDRTCFTQVNALQLDAFPLKGLSVIYCQNLLIYFRRWRRREILNALAERLLPGGLLIIGLGEMVDWQHPDLIQVEDNNLSAYIRRADT